MTSSVVPVDPALFASLVKASGSFAKELRFSFGPEGVSFRAMDPGTVAFASWSLGPQHFLELPLEALSVELLDDFASAFKGVKKGDELSVLVDEAVVAVVVSRGSQRIRKAVPRRNFGRPQGRVLSDVKMEKMFLDASIRCSFRSSSFGDALGEFPSGDGQRLSFQALPEGLVLSMFGDAGAATSVKLAPLESGEYVEGAGAGRFAVEYLHKALEFVKPAFTLCHLRWTPEYPLLVAGEFGGEAVRVVIAPVVEND